MSKSLSLLVKKRIVSKLLSSLFTKDWQWSNHSQFLLERATSVILSWLKLIALKKQFFTVFPLFYAQGQISPVFPQLLFFKDRREWFAPVDHDKRASVSDLLPLLMTKNDRGTFLLFPSKLLFRSQKTIDLLEKPMSKFVTLPKFNFSKQNKILIKYIYAYA